MAEVVVALLSPQQKLVAEQAFREIYQLEVQAWCERFGFTLSSLRAFEPFMAGYAAGLAVNECVPTGRCILRNQGLDR